MKTKSYHDATFVANGSAITKNSNTNSDDIVGIMLTHVFLWIIHTAWFCMKLNFILEAQRCYARSRRPFSMTSSGEQIGY